MSPLPEVAVGSAEPLYNIGAVARMTGVSMVTLRAWERRYQFPDSERTAGGHRLYSERDVIRLRWVKERIDEGMQTAQAISALRHQENTGHLAMAAQPSQEHEEKTLPTPHLQTIEHQLTQALMQRDLINADHLLGEALAFFPADDLIVDVIAPTLAHIGSAWESGEISIATEHLATNYLRQRLSMWMISSPPPKAVSPILLACAPNEWHEGSLLILGALLRRRRWPVVYLGQAEPLQDLAHFVRQVRPSLVVLVAMSENSAAELSDWPRYLPETIQSGQPIVGYGGRIFALQPQQRLRMAGIYLGDTFREGLATIERLLPPTTT